jgi:hypothetical protein
MIPQFGQHPTKLIVQSLSAEQLANGAGAIAGRRRVRCGTGGGGGRCQGPRDPADGGAVGATSGVLLGVDVDGAISGAGVVGAVAHARKRTAFVTPPQMASGMALRFIGWLLSSPYSAGVKGATSDMPPASRHARC